MDQTFDSKTAKKREFDSWTMVAPGWRKHDAMLVRGSAAASEKMVELTQVGPKARVLDIASGTGEPALRLAEKVGSSGFVLGTDFVEEMLDFAKEKAAARGLTQVEFRRVDGETLDVPAGSFDAVTIRWGLMFMPDPLACLRAAHKALKPGGRIVVACWKGPDENPFVAVPLAALKRHMDVPTPPPGAPGIFSFADPKRLEESLREAGFSDVKLDSVAVTMAEFPTGKDFFVYIRELAGPVASLLAQLPREKQDVVEKEVVTEVEKRFRNDGQVRVGGVTWIASAKK